MKDKEILPTNENLLKKLINLKNDKYMLERMLDNTETFEMRNDKDLVTPEAVIENMYDAIFVNEYTIGEYSKRVGEYEFTKNSKELAIKMANMLVV